MLLAQHIIAKNTPSGNPQRLFLIWDDSTIYALDEGYKGTPDFLQNPETKVYWLPTVHVTKTTYHNLIKTYAGT